MGTRGSQPFLGAAGLPPPEARASRFWYDRYAVRSIQYVSGMNAAA